MSGPYSNRRRKRYAYKSAQLYFFIYAVDKSKTLQYTGNYC